MQGLRSAAVVMALGLAVGSILAAADQAGLSQGRDRAPLGPEMTAPRAGGTTGTPDASFEDLAGQVVQLYERNARVWLDETLSQAEKQKRSRDIMQQVSHLLKQIHQTGRHLHSSTAYQAWLRKTRAEGRRRRLQQIRGQLRVKDDNEWQVLAPKIDLVLRTREELAQAEHGTGLSSPPDRLQELRAETAKADPDKRRLKAVLDAIRADRAAARQEVARLRATLHRAQQDLISVLTLAQEAVLVVNQVIE
jgi:chromosome segregation ATPase